MKITRKNITVTYPCQLLAENTAILDISLFGSCRRKSAVESAALIIPTDSPSVLLFTLFEAEQKESEFELLTALSAALADIKTLITFNGNAFDLPRLHARYLAAVLPDPLFGKKYRDLFIEFRPLSAILGLPSRKLVDYAAIITEPVAISEDKLLEYTDAFRTLSILPLDSILRVLDGEFYELSASESFESKTPASDFSGISENRPIPSVIFFKAKCSRNFPCRISFHDAVFHVVLSDNQIAVAAHLDRGCLRVYHSDIENYYYLPAENCSIHRSIADYVDKSRKEKAVRENCFHLSKYSPEFIKEPKQIEKYFQSILRFLVDVRL